MNMTISCTYIYIYIYIYIEGEREREIVGVWEMGAIIQCISITVSSMYSYNSVIVH